MSEQPCEFDYCTEPTLHLARGGYAIMARMTILRFSFMTFAVTLVLVAAARAAGRAMPTEMISFQHGDRAYLLDVQTRQQVTLARSRNIAWAHNRTHYALARDGQVLTGRLGAGIPQPVTGIELLINAISPTWSPDGAQIAYMAGVGSFIDLYLTDFENAPRRLTTNAIVVEGPVWSPDGAQIAYVDARQNIADLFVIDAEPGARPRRLTNRANVTGPVWSPNGTQLAFITRDNPLWTINVIDINSGGSTTLAEFVRPISSLAWSPTGTQLAMIVSERRNRLYVLTPGDDARRIRTHPHGHIHHLLWSGDGAQLIGYGPEQLGTGFYTVNPHTGQAQYIAYVDGVEVHHMVWANDVESRFVGTVLDRATNTQDLHLITNEGLRRLTVTPGPEINPVWLGNPQ